MHNAFGMSSGKPPGRLNGDVQHLRNIGKVSVGDALLKAAPVDVVGERSRDSADDADVVAGNDVRMEGEVDPELGLSHESFQGFGTGDELWAGALDREGLVPAAVQDLVHDAHASLTQDLLHLVEIEQYITGSPRDFFGVVRRARPVGHGDRDVRKLFAALHRLDLISGLVNTLIVATGLVTFRSHDSPPALTAVGPSQRPRPGLRHSLELRKNAGRAEPTVSRILEPLIELVEVLGIP